MPTIELNEQFKKALALMEGTGSHVFVTGRAGTGKSTLLEYFRDHTKKRIAVLAPTGVAALNVHGQTIHSFFGFHPGITVEKARALGKKALHSGPKRRQLYEKLDALVIDEISMVRADLLDCVDAFLRVVRKQPRTPFGGLQIIMIGDLYQLPPVVTTAERHAFTTRYQSPYFFSCDVMGNLPMEYLELEKIYRQSDAGFITILNAVRNNTIEDELLTRLNERTNPAFEPPRKEFWIALTPTNAAAAAINELRLAELQKPVAHYEGVMSGNFKPTEAPTELNLSLKVGAQIMMVANDRNGRWVNGTVGRIAEIEEGERDEPDSLLVTFAGGRVATIEPYTWEVFSYRYEPENRQLMTDVVGTFTQYPLRLAWAVTIHKAQGKTFDRVIIDMGRGAFAHGQTYVALSRCRTLPGLVLKTPIKRGHVFVDWHVRDFVTKYQYDRSAERVPTKEKVRVIEAAIRAKQKLQITYLRKQDEKSCRVIRPTAVGEMEYEGKPFLGIEAFCEMRQDTRVFRVDRILELAPVKNV